ncbi:MAG TPA: 2-C-methyl-D-erythritol 4-phosphate cytidylyltransferase [Thermoanaerobaculia bacterium]|nr:2-C-methyl-D-erythritol 4-phosphate cytidylyltransferase [Thermoanaerobaculia bacterium]
MNWSLIIPAAGTGSRFGGELPKQFLPLKGRPLIAHTIESFLDERDLSEVVVAVSPDRRVWFDDLVNGLGWSDQVRSIAGGATRQQSVSLAVASLRLTDTLVIAVHDAVRPFLKSSILRAALKGAEDHGASLVAIPVVDTIHRVEDRLIVETPQRDHLVAAQTPQCFRASILIDILNRAGGDGLEASDEAGLAVHYGYPVRIIEGDAANFKITRPEDWSVADANYELWRSR